MFTRFATKLALVPALVALSVPAFAQATNPVDQIFAGIDLSTVTVAVVALGIVVMGIVMAFKGIDLGKRGVSKA